MPRAMPRIGTVSRIVRQRSEERRRQTFKILTSFTNDVTRHKLRRVFEHMNKAVQFTQHIVWDRRRSLRFTVQENRNVRIRASDLMHESSQFCNGFVFFTGVGKIVVVKTYDKGRSATCLTRQTREIGKRGNGANLLSLRFNSLCKVSNAKTGDVFRMVSDIS